MAELITLRSRARSKPRAQSAGSRIAGVAASAPSRIESAGRPAKLAALLAAAGFGALAQHFLFERGRAAQRRRVARDRTRAALRRSARNAVRRAKYAGGVYAGIAHKSAHALPGVGAGKQQPDDVTLAQKVESTAFRAAHVSKEHVNVNAENGIVFLRGWLEREDDIAELVKSARAVEGVRGVENLLHVHSSTERQAS
jgi:osmotically-inducible protein OsmY